MKDKSNVFYSNPEGTEFYVYTKSPGDWAFIKTLEILETHEDISSCAKSFLNWKASFEWTPVEFYIVFYNSNRELKKDNKRVHTSMSGELYGYVELMSSSVKNNEYNKHLEPAYTLHSWHAADHKFESIVNEMGLETHKQEKLRLEEERRADRLIQMKSSFERLDENEILKTRSERIYVDQTTSKKCHHIYFLYDNDVIVYVGQTTAVDTSPHSRPLSHSKEGIKKHDSYELFEVPLDLEIDLVEGYFINKYKPKYNSSMPVSNKVFEKLSS